MKETADIWTLLQNFVALGVFKIGVPIATAAGFKVVNFTATEVVRLVENNNFGSSKLRIK